MTLLLSFSYARHSFCYAILHCNSSKYELDSHTRNHHARHFTTNYISTAISFIFGDLAARGQSCDGVFKPLIYLVYLKYATVINNTVKCKYLYEYII